jgi:hypothetical protein
MEEIALGEMQMTITELDAITPRSLFNKLHGFRANQQMPWERMRIQTYLLLQPHIEKGGSVTPQSLIPMPWDTEILQTQKEQAKEIRERSKALWAKIDEDKKKKE